MNPHQRVSIEVELYVRQRCAFSDRTKQTIIDICRRFDQVHLSIFDTSTQVLKRPSISITPAIWANDELWYLGTFDATSFEEKLAHLSAGMV
ncbi:MAG: hypothetical protein K9M49_04855 [Candidatus Marinimicrobia bacterium]|nr:hypothetical protein [Candidatus Neomarinimicrobiota bacterium]MCF7850664.1 hypothetical protein [Candidatus Neomarinimicrobiota bacterium]MCF7904467.1 hypothetical protein [Candidatus Neomarinimicrobiota bacterium]